MQSTKFVIKFDATPRRGMVALQVCNNHVRPLSGTIVSLEFIGEVPEGVRGADQTRN